MQRRLSPGGGVFCFCEGLKRRKPCIPFGDARLAKIRMAASDKNASEPGTPVRKTFPEQAAMSPAVLKQIAAHPYRTVIGTLSKDESRSFFEKFPKKFFIDAIGGPLPDRIWPRRRLISLRDPVGLPT
jgi:hypothetical protein